MTRKYKGAQNQYRDQEWLRLYRSGSSIQDIADMWHYAYGTVSRVLRFYGVEQCYPRMNLRVN